MDEKEEKKLVKNLQITSKALALVATGCSLTPFGELAPFLTAGSIILGLVAAGMEFVSNNEANLDLVPAPAR